MDQYDGDLNIEDNVRIVEEATPNLTLAEWAVQNLKEEEAAALDERGYNTWSDIYEAFPAVPVNTEWVDPAAVAAFQQLCSELSSSNFRQPKIKKVLLEATRKNPRAKNLSGPTPPTTRGAPSTLGIKSFKHLCITKQTNICASLQKTRKTLCQSVL